MRITFIRIGQFGGVRDRTFELQPGLNVFYGPNEAGKSTIRSFVTTTMFPKAPLKYPAQKGGDSGSLDVTLDNGHALVFERNGRKCSGTGSAICGIDDKEYIAIYSMSPEDLRDVKAIEKGDIRNRFLTIPGGGDLPAAYMSLDDERTALLPDTKRSSRCEIARLIEREHELSVKVRNLQRREAGDSQYAELARRRNALVAELEEAGAHVRTADLARVASLKVSGRADDLQRIGELTERVGALAYAEGTDPSALSVLEAEISACRKAAENAARDLELSRSDLGGRDPAVFLRNRERIQRLDAMATDYDFYRRQAVPAPAAPVQPVASGRNLPIITVIGAVVTVGGIAVAALVQPVAGAVMTVLGAIVAVMGIRSRRNAAPVERTPVRTVEPVDDRVTRIEEMLDEVAIDTCIERRGFHADVRLLTTVLARSEAFRGAEERRTRADDALAQAERELELFLSGHGGREGFEQAVRDARELAEVRAKLAELEKSTADLQPEVVDTETAEEDYREANERVRQLTADLAKTEQALKDISEDTTVEEAITASSDASDDVYAACHRWARLMLEKIILDEASDNAYGNHRPDVLKRADGFLAQMTDDRYRINTDPRVTEISVIERDTNVLKTVKEWSSGLEDQIKLSVKMAVSLSLAQERPPFILDDVLLTSDSGRKRSACTALAALSEDIQVLYFTCDRETRDLLEAAGGRVLTV